MNQPGWYAAQGDPPGTVRWWDGATWVGGPTHPPGTTPPPGTGAAYSPPGHYVGSGPTEHRGPFGYFIKGWKKSFDYSGRARRAEYGWFTLILFIVRLLMFVPFIAALIAESEQLEPGADFDDFPSYVWWLLALAGMFFAVSIIPGIAMSVRRWHDQGFSGWMWLLNIPAAITVGSLPLILWQVIQDSKREPNQWGVSPKYG